MTIYLKKLSEPLYRWWSKLLDIVGDIKIFKYPLFVAYDPNFFDMTGEKISEALEILRPGDVVLRGYDFYLDSCFINGDYSHGSIYVGDNTIVHAVSPHVQRVHAIDFMECDRICILRPRNHKLVKKALQIANDLADRKVPYDFDFNTDDPEDVYCFELAARCYPKIEFEQFDQSFFLGLVSKTTYLAKSFTDSEDLETVFEFNPRKKVSFSKPSSKEK